MSESSDRDAIIAVKYKYGQVIDRLVREGPGANREELADVFTPDADINLVEAGLPPLAGLAAAMAHFGDVMPEHVEWMWHAFHNPVITVTGDTARAEWLLSAYSRPKTDPDAPPLATVGRYLDTYLRTARGWRLNSTLFKLGSRFSTGPA